MLVFRQFVVQLAQTVLSVSDSGITIDQCECTDLSLQGDNIYELKRQTRTFPAFMVDGP